MELVLTLPTIRVCGSAAPASARSATIPASPTRGSTANGWPRICCIRAVTVRAENSVEPPGGRGTITRTPRLGYPCAHAS